MRYLQIEVDTPSDHSPQGDFTWYTPLYKIWHFKTISDLTILQMLLKNIQKDICYCLKMSNPTKPPVSLSKKNNLKWRNGWSQSPQRWIWLCKIVYYEHIINKVFMLKYILNKMADIFLEINWKWIKSRYLNWRYQKIWVMHWRKEKAKKK